MTNEKRDKLKTEKRKRNRGLQMVMEGTIIVDGRKIKPMRK